MGKKASDAMKRAGEISRATNMRMNYAALTTLTAPGDGGLDRARTPAAKVASPDFTAAMARIESTPANFYGWMDALSPWPDDQPETLGPKGD